MRLVCLLVAVLAAQAAPPAAPVVRVAAASDLRFALDEVAAQLARRRPAIAVVPTYGSSGNLHAQLRQRAPFDVFLSADVAYPVDLMKSGRGAQEDLFTYALGRVVVWVPNGSALPIDRGLRALTDARRLAIANPAHAPYGRAAEAALRRAGLWERLQPRLVLGENIAQTAQFVESGGADAGIIAKSLAVADAMRGRGRWWEVPPAAYPELRQGGLILAGAQSRPAALALRDFLLGEEGRALLTRNGFGLPAR